MSAAHAKPQGQRERGRLGCLEGSFTSVEKEMGDGGGGQDKDGARG